MSDAVLIEHDGDVAVVVINRPPTNYFSFSLIKALGDTYDQLAAEGARALVLSSDGKHFCAGADFSGGEMTADRTTATRNLYTEAIRLFRSAVPVVAAVQGAAVGGGLGLACSADFRTASAASRFHANFSMLGFHQGFGLSASLPDIVGIQHAKDLLYTSRRLDGTAAHRIGLVDRLAEPGQERAVAIELAHEIAAAAPLAVRSMHATLRAPLVERVSRVLDRELDEQALLWETEDSQEAIRANLARQTPTFRGR